MNEILKKRIEEAAVEHAESIPQSDERKEYSREDFIAGAEYALSHQWIRVEEALPEEDSSVFMNVYVEVDTGRGIEHCVLLSTYYSGKFSCESNHVKVITWISIPKFETKKL